MLLAILAGLQPLPHALYDSASYNVNLQQNSTKTNSKLVDRDNLLLSGEFLMNLIMIFAVRSLVLSNENAAFYCIDFIKHPHSLAY